MPVDPQQIGEMSQQIKNLDKNVGEINKEIKGMKRDIYTVKDNQDDMKRDFDRVINFMKWAGGIGLSYAIVQLIQWVGSAIDYINAARSLGIEL